ncbi:MAG: hypothetical protein CSA96_06185 [Bacteroidetes bacterium]|nr:MAG: hypothetical protein CSA96_06185 [Bacteroidota bacterium]
MANTETPTGKTSLQASSDAAWSKLYARLEEDGLLEEKMAGYKSVSVPWRSIAAGLVLFLAAGIAALYFGPTERTRGMNELTATEGIRTLDLPDGSRVILNQDARIAYPSDFVRNRQMELEGEAFFRVMSDPSNPFTLNSGRVRLTVLGTSFNVKNEKKGVEVLVESGTVKIDSKSGKKELVLTRGEFARASRDELIRAETKDPNYLSWKTKEFRFVDTELKEVIETLQRAYHVEIRPLHPSIEEFRITTTYSGQTIEAILETVSAAFGLQVEKLPEGYTLKNLHP